MSDDFIAVDKRRIFLAGVKFPSKFRLRKEGKLWQ